MPIAEMDLTLWEECLAVNIRGVMLCMREAARLMTADVPGRSSICHR